MLTTVQEFSHVPDDSRKALGSPSSRSPESLLDPPPDAVGDVSSAVCSSIMSEMPPHAVISASSATAPAHRAVVRYRVPVAAVILPHPPQPDVPT
jgi:hypothetical protein